MKQIPEFTSLEQNDQVALIKSAVPEALLLKVRSSLNFSQLKPLSGCYLLWPHEIEVPHFRRQLELWFWRTHGERSFESKCFFAATSMSWKLILFQTFIERLKQFLVKFNQIDLCKDEFILINLVVLFSSDRIGLFNSNRINQYQGRDTWFHGYLVGAQLEMFCSYFWLMSSLYSALCFDSWENDESTRS